MIRYTILCALIFACVGFFQTSAYAAWARREVSKGNSLYSKEKYKDALKEYEKALTRLPDSSIPAFNAGATHYKLGDYGKAEEVYLRSLSTEDKDLEAKASYNIGNAKYRQGEPVENTETEKAIKLYKEALEYYKRAMELDETDEDAKFNYDFVKKKLEKLLKKKPEEKQQEQKEQEKKEKKDKEKPKEEKKEKQKEKEQKEKKKQKQEKQKEKEQKEKEKQEQERQKQKEKEKQKKKREQERKKREQKEREEKKQKEKEEQDRQEPYPRPDELSEEEAKMLLEGFRQEEESKGKPVKVRTGQYQEAVKDW